MGDFGSATLPPGIGTHGLREITGDLRPLTTDRVNRALVELTTLVATCVVAFPIAWF